MPLRPLLLSTGGRSPPYSSIVRPTGKSAPHDYESLKFLHNGGPLCYVLLGRRGAGVGRLEGEEGRTSE